MGDLLIRCCLIYVNCNPTIQDPVEAHLIGTAIFKAYSAPKRVTICLCNINSPGWGTGAGSCVSARTCWHKYCQCFPHNRGQRVETYISNIHSDFFLIQEVGGWRHRQLESGAENGTTVLESTPLGLIRVPAIETYNQCRFSLHVIRHGFNSA